MKLLVNGYTMGEHMEIRRGCSSLEKEMNKLDNVLNHLKKHKSLYRKLVVIVAFMFISGYIHPSLAYADVADIAVMKIDIICARLFDIVRHIGQYACIINVDSWYCERDFKL